MVKKAICAAAAGAELWTVQFFFSTSSIIPFAGVLHSTFFFAGDTFFLVE
jgi:hypothetical protein